MLQRKALCVTTEREREREREIKLFDIVRKMLVKAVRARK